MPNHPNKSQTIHSPASANPNNPHSARAPLSSLLSPLLKECSRLIQAYVATGNEDLIEDLSDIASTIEFHCECHLSGDNAVFTLDEVKASLPDPKQPT